MENYKMTHDDYLYIIEIFLRHGNLEFAENLAKIMKASFPDLLAIPRQRVIDAGFTPYYL